MLVEFIDLLSSVNIDFLRLQMFFQSNNCFLVFDFKKQACSLR